MRYLNSRLGPLKNLFPDMYDASSIDDFLATKDQIPKPSTWKLIDVLINGKPRDTIMIDFYNVRLSSAISRDGWILSDDQHELFLFPLYPELNKEEMSRYQDGLYDRVRVFYLPKYDRLHLTSAMGLREPIPRDLERKVTLIEQISKSVH